MAYREYPAAPALQEYIYCYWHLHTLQKLKEEYNYNVVADGCIDIFFELDNPHNSFVMGFCKTATTFSLDRSFNYFGIRFLPAAFTRLFKIAAFELTNTFEPLSLVVPAVAAHLSYKGGNDPDALQTKNILDRYFTSLLAGNMADADPRFYNALSKIVKHHGMVNIEDGIDTGISTRQLRRMFEFYIGTNAKTFSRVVRFQNVLNSGYDSITDKVYLDLGYYDQAHFIKEFKDFYGMTPGRLKGK